jgi:hypothetical protein
VTRISRRRFFGATGAIGMTGLAVARAGAQPADAAPGTRPLMIASANGVKALETGMAILRRRTGQAQSPR